MKIFLFNIILCLILTACGPWAIIGLDDDLPIVERSLAIANTDGSNYIKLIERFEGIPKFAHNDENIITLKGTQGEKQFWKVNTNEIEPEIILDDLYVDETHFSLSPIDNLLVFSDRYDIYIFNYQTEVLTNITDSYQDGTYRYPSFSPDGSKIILYAVTYTDSTTSKSISTINLDDLSINPIIILNSYIENPIFSQDMTKVIYKSYSNICICDSDGSNFQVISTGAYNTPISTGGNYIVFSLSSMIYSYNFVTNQLEEVTEGSDPIIAIDGSQIIYEDFDPAWDTHLYKINIDGSDKVKHKRIFDNYYSFSNSGEKIVYIRVKVTYD